MTDPSAPSPAAPPPAPGPRRSRSLLPWVATLGLIALAVGVVLYGAAREVPPPPPTVKRLANVEVHTVQLRPYREALVLPARLEADRVADVSPEFAGRLARWLASEGEQVAEGQVVAELDTRTLDAGLAEVAARKASAEKALAQAALGVEAGQVALENARKEVEVRALALRGAEADRDLARTEHGRAQNLVEQKVLDRARLDTAVNALAQAEVRVGQGIEVVAAAELGVRAAQVGLEEAGARLASARSVVEELDAAAAALRVQLAKTRLRAPISGRLEEHLAEPGEVVDSGRSLARLYDLSRLKAVVQVPDRFVAFLDTANPAAREFVRLNRPGATQDVRARVVVPGLPKLTGGEGRGIEVPAAIARIAQAADPASNTFAVELRVENPGGALKHGILARAELEYLTFPEAVVIPLAAVQVTDVGPRVFLLRGAGGHAVAEARDVVPGSIRDDAVQILEGLAGGERLIVAGWKGLVSGTEVNVVVEDGLFLGVGDGAGTP